jgi:Thermostable hemolysin
MRLVELSTDHPLRPDAIRLIKSIYLESYGAIITNLPSMILALADKEGTIHAAAGWRDSSEPYFSEHYLDAPVETIIGGIARTRVCRESIVEVSSLASRTPAISARFMTSLVLYGEELGFEWGFFTATSRLEKLLRRMGLPLIALGTASASRVQNPGMWGSYYETAPKVVAFGREQLTPFLRKQAQSALAYEACAHG